MVSKSLKVLLILNALILVWNVLGATGHAQRPPATNADGIPFFNVNINPTNTPPMVNINPNGATPRVAVVDMPDLSIAQMPEVHVAATGCNNRGNFQTAIGRSINGPLVVTYLNASAPIQATLSDPQGADRKITLASGAQLATAIYLRGGQRLDFDADILYSGCQPQ
jgi:hypothetical protein